jgi:hypothetical protein
LVKKEGAKGRSAHATSAYKANKMPIERRRDFVSLFEEHVLKKREKFQEQLPYSFSIVCHSMILVYVVGYLFPFISNLLILKVQFNVR